MKSFQAQTHYEVLEISVGASPAEVRNAYERLSHLYSDDQIVLYGLIDPARATALRNRLQEALEVLSDDQRREAYDLKIGLPPRIVLAPVAVPRPSRPTQPAAASAGTGWGTFAWVTPAAPAQPPRQPASYTYAVPALKPVEAAAIPPPPEVAPEPKQLVLDVASGVPGWGLRPVAEPAPPPEPVAPPSAPEPPALSAPASVPEPAVLPQPPPVVPEPPPLAVAAVEPEKAAAPVEEPPIPTLADDAQVAIIPARATPSREFRVEQRLRPYEIPEGVEINGDLLKQVRLAKGLSLVQVAERTRIGVKHLENVEGDRYDALPAAVYLRGILMNLARELGLDGLRVSRSYLTFVEAHRSKG